MHLERWLDKARVEIVAWAAVGVARQQQFGYDSVSKFWQCERDQCGFNSHSNRIKCERAFRVYRVRLWDRRSKEGGLGGQSPPPQLSALCTNS